MYRLSQTKDNREYEEHSQWSSHNTIGDSITTLVPQPVFGCDALVVHYSLYVVYVSTIRGEMHPETRTNKLEHELCAITKTITCTCE